jgi:hypothetical protein
VGGQVGFFFASKGSMISHSLSLRLLEYVILCQILLLSHSKRSQMGSIRQRIYSLAFWRLNWRFGILPLVL